MNVDLWFSIGALLISTATAFDSWRLRRLLRRREAEAAGSPVSAADAAATVFLEEAKREGVTVARFGRQLLIIEPPRTGGPEAIAELKRRKKEVIAAGGRARLLAAVPRARPI